MMCIVNVRWNVQPTHHDIKVIVILRELVCNIVSRIIMLLIQIDHVSVLVLIIILSIELYRLLSIDV